MRTKIGAGLVIRMVAVTVSCIPVLPEMMEIVVTLEQTMMFDDPVVFVADIRL